SADDIFVPGLESPEEMARMAQAVERPLNIYAGDAGLPPVAELRRAAVRRQRRGRRPFPGAPPLAPPFSTETRHEWTCNGMTTNMLSAGEVKSLFSTDG